VSLLSSQTAAAEGDEKGTKRAFVDLVAEIQAWSGAAGLANRISGIQ
jgi:hypothetical protein